MAVGAERLGAVMYLPRRKVVKTFCELVTRDGPAAGRAMCYSLVLASVFVMPAELAIYGKKIAIARAAADDDA